MSSSTLSWGTQNIAVASSLAAMGFPVRTQVAQDDRTGNVLTQFFFGQRSLFWSQYKLQAVITSWKKEEMEKLDPLHPFLCGLRAEHNFKMLATAQRTGQHIRLVGDGQKCASKYEFGEELASLVNAKEVIVLNDMSLVAALGTVGIPVIKIESAGGHHTYTLPVKGHWLMDGPQLDGVDLPQAIQYDAVAISRRKEVGKLDLALEESDPLHPLVCAYNTRHVHNQLKRHLGQTKRRIIVRPPGTNRMAVISDNPAPHVLEAMQRHFRI